MNIFWKRISSPNNKLINFISKRHAQTGGMVKYKIYRYIPGVDKAPRMQDYTVDLSKLPNHMTLDALIYIKATQDGTLTFRKSCREGICGSCGMNINGLNCLACITRIQKTNLVLPMPSMYVIKDLVTDFKRFYDHYTKIKPYLMVKKQSKRPRKQHIQSIRDFAKIEVLYECILCGCCTHSCPAYWWHQPSFLGAAALFNAYRWIIDSRDEYALERLNEIKSEMNLFRCHTIYSCTCCCPKKLNPGLALTRLKRLAVGLEKKEKPDVVK